MRITRKQFNEMLALAKSLTGAARKELMAKLNGCTIVDTDDKGVETEVIAKVIDEAGEEPEASTQTEDEIVEKAAKKAEEVIIAKANAPANRPAITQPTIEVKAGVPNWARKHAPTYFKGVRDGKTAEERAFRFGMWAIAAVGKSSKATKWCSENGIPVQWVEDTESKAAHGENANELGGFLVPEEFDADLIDLRLQYGVFRRNARYTPMSSDTKNRSRRTGGLTAYFVGEAQAGTVSNKGWDRVQLIAKKLMVLALVSNELNEDAAINIGDDLAQEIAYAFAYKEDLCGFLGDATSAYGGILGVNTRLTTVNGVDEGGGLILAAGNAYSEIILSDFNRTVARLPSYARLGAKWYASPTFNDSVMQKLAFAAGGVPGMEIINGVPTNKFLGYPVELTEVMPVTEANSQVCAVFGNLQMAAMFGDRRGTTISFSEHATVGSINCFETDQIAVRGTERFDINVHDVGTATVAGPVVGLITAAS